MKLLEGLRESDLEGLVLPVISIDQYESKIDDDAIVIAFYVEYKDPAIDLNRFIQKSAAEILDTEVSPAPTEDGYYVVFVEVIRDDKFPKILSAILENISNLVDFSSWRFTAYAEEGVYDLNNENLLAYVRLKPEDEKITKEEMYEFFIPSSLDNLSIKGDLITFNRGLLTESYKVIDFGDIATLAVRKSHLLREAFITGSHYQRQRLEALLGASWLIEAIHDVLLLQNGVDDRLMLLATV